MDALELKTPLSEDDVRKLRTGDILYVSGRIFTGRSNVYRRLLEEGAVPPIDLSKVNVLWHLGPIMKKERNKWKVFAAGATASVRFEKWAPRLVRSFKVRAFIGKGSLGLETSKACAEIGCVHLGKVGMTTGALYARRVVKVLESHWVDLGVPEALWVLQVKELGPLVVTLDADGHTLYEDTDRLVINRGIPNAKKAMGIEKFEFAEL